MPQIPTTKQGSVSLNGNSAQPKKPDPNENMAPQDKATSIKDYYRAVVKNPSYADTAKYSFWATHPVHKFKEPMLKNTQIKKLDKETTSKEQTKLSEHFCWYKFDLTKEEDVTEIVTFLTKNYHEEVNHTFRQVFNADFIKWYFGRNKSWLIGIKTNDKMHKKNILMGFIGAIQTKTRIYNKTVDMAESNFMCVHHGVRDYEAFNGKRVFNLAPSLINELTRLVALDGIYHGIYSSDRYLPVPLTEIYQYHRTINLDNLVDGGFCEPVEEKNKENVEKELKIPESHKVNMRLAKKEDMDTIYELYSKNEIYNLYPLHTKEELEKMFLGSSAVRCFVFESSSAKVTDFISYYFIDLKSGKNNKIVKQAFLYYYCFDETPINIGAHEVLVELKKDNVDVFTVPNIMENKLLIGLPELHLERGAVTKYYYLYNWSCELMFEKKFGTNRYNSQVGYLVP